MTALEEITKRRAYIVFEALKDELMEGGGTELQAEAFRFSFLVLKGAKAFLESFGVGSLYLDYDKISEIYYILRFDLPGAKGLSDEEEKILYVHNRAVMELERSANTASCFS